MPAHALGLAGTAEANDTGSSLPTATHWYMTPLHSNVWVRVADTNGKLAYVARWCGFAQHL
ncbi:hypothetical protein [Streptomyces sp. NPDC002078]